MAYIIYFFITLFATAIGSLTGMGGGVIIKPVLDVLGDFDVATINLLASASVFVMALVSVIKQVRQNSVLDLKMVAVLATGSLIGGSIGQQILERVIAALHNNSLVIAVQNSCLATIILVVFLYMRKGESRSTLDLRGPLPVLLTGTLMGVSSSFLGIGGGPVNVALMIFVCACDIKTASLFSIITILFAQTSKLTSVALSGNLSHYDLSILPFMIVGAVLGGLAGSHLNRRLTEINVERAFNAVQILVFSICLFNIINSLIYK